MLMVWNSKGTELCNKKHSSPHHPLAQPRPLSPGPAHEHGDWTLCLSPLPRLARSAESQVPTIFRALPGPDPREPGCATQIPRKVLNLFFLRDLLVHLRLRTPGQDGGQQLRLPSKGAQPRSPVPLKHSFFQDVRGAGPSLDRSSKL